MLNSVFIKLFVQTVHFCALLEFPMFRWRNVTYRTHLCCNLTIHDVQSAINGRELVADGCCNMKQFQLSPSEHLSVTPITFYCVPLILSTQQRPAWCNWSPRAAWQTRTQINGDVDSRDGGLATFISFRGCSILVAVVSSVLRALSFSSWSDWRLPSNFVNRHTSTTVCSEKKHPFCSIA